MTRIAGTIEFVGAEGADALLSVFVEGEAWGTSLELAEVGRVKEVARVASEAYT